jgi:hypothetical protein
MLSGWISRRILPETFGPLDDDLDSQDDVDDLIWSDDEMKP